MSTPSVVAIRSMTRRTFSACMISGYGSPSRSARVCSHNGINRADVRGSTGPEHGHVVPALHQPPGSIPVRISSYRCAASEIADQRPSRQCRREPRSAAARVSLRVRREQCRCLPLGDPLQIVDFVEVGVCGCCQLSVDPAFELVLPELNRAESGHRDLAQSPEERPHRMTRWRMPGGGRKRGKSATAHARRNHGLVRAVRVERADQGLGRDEGPPRLARRRHNRG